MFQATFKEFLTEAGRGTSIPESDAIKLIKTKYAGAAKMALKRDYLFRGVARNKSDITEIKKGASKYRPSRNMKDLIIPLTLRHPKWENIPKREIIATTDINKAETYGQTMLVLPKDGAVIAHINYDDWWESLPTSTAHKAGLKLRHWGALEYAFRDLLHILDEANESFDYRGAVSHVIDLFRDTMNAATPKAAYEFYQGFEILWNDMLDQGMLKQEFVRAGERYTQHLDPGVLFDTLQDQSLEDVMNMMLAPSILGVSVKKIPGKYPTEGVEVWLDDDCLFVSEKWWDANEERIKEVLM